MHRTDSERLSATLEYENVQVPSPPGMLRATNCNRAIIPERDELVVSLNKYNMCEETIERKISEQKVIIRAMNWCVEQLKCRRARCRTRSTYYKRLMKTMGSYGEVKPVE